MLTRSGSFFSRIFCKKVFSIIATIYLDQIEFGGILGAVMTYSIQEQEHIDFVAGVGTELQNAFAVSHANIPANAEEMGTGPYIVKVSAICYCPITDAIAGSYLIENRRFETEEGQTAYVDSLPEILFQENAVEIIKPPVQGPAPKTDFEDIPF